MVFKFLEDFIEKNCFSLVVKWPRYLSLKMLELIHQETSIQTIILNRAAFIHFVKRYQKNHLKSTQIGEIIVINPIPITIRTNPSVLKNPLKRKVKQGRPPLNPELEKVIHKLQDRMTQQELAKFLGVSQSTISKYIKR